jgi:putative transposase
MSRPLRVEYPGAWYHVMNRGRRSDKIFELPNDYLMFIDLLKDATELWDIRITAYCLMPIKRGQVSV